MVMRADGMASKPKAPAKTKGPVAPKNTQPKQSTTGGTFAMEGMGNYNSSTNSYQNPGTPSKVTPNPQRAAQRAGGGGASAPAQYSGGPLTSSATGVVGQPAPAPQMSQDEWNLQDSVYNTEMGGIQGELEALMSSLSQQKANYSTDFGSNLRDLGWQTQGGLEGDAWKQGAWNEGDQNTAYGRSYANNQNDYSGRGMMGSSFYSQALEDLMRSFDSQRDAYGTDASRFLGENTAGVNNANTSATQAKAQAAQSAAARRAAQYGL